MRKLLLTLMSFALLCAAIFAAPTHAAPRRIVLVVAEGMTPQVADFGSMYVKTAFEENGSLALDDVKNLAKTHNADGDALSSLRGLLKTARANGYKTGLVTTGEVAQVAPLFFDIAGEDAARALTSTANYNMLAGGGRAAFAGMDQAFAAAGNSPLFTLESLDNEENKGKILALQSDASLSYSLDRDIEKEGGLGELTTLALQTLNADESPFVLVVHDNLLAKALAAKDTPAWLAQFREVDGVIADVLGAREENPADFAVAVLGTGSAVAPRFTTELPAQRSEALYIISALPMSYGKAAATLNGADEAKLTAFATEGYKGWQLSPENRAALLGGTLAPEAALRASYEPALRIAYEPVAAQNTVQAIGFDASNGLAAALNAIVSAKPASEAPLVPVG